MINVNISSGFSSTTYYIPGNTQVLEPRITEDISTYGRKRMPELTEADPKELAGQVLSDKLLSLREITLPAEEGGYGEELSQFERTRDAMVADYVRIPRKQRREMREDVLAATDQAKEELKAMGKLDRQARTDLRHLQEHLLETLEASRTSVEAFQTSTPREQAVVGGSQLQVTSEVTSLNAEIEMTTGDGRSYALRFSSDVTTNTVGPATSGSAGAAANVPSVYKDVTSSINLALFGQASSPNQPLASLAALDDTLTDEREADAQSKEGKNYSLTPQSPFKFDLSGDIEPKEREQIASYIQDLAAITESYYTPESKVVSANQLNHQYTDVSEGPVDDISAYRQLLDYSTNQAGNELELKTQSRQILSEIVRLVAGYDDAELQEQLLGTLPVYRPPSQIDARV